MLTGKSTSRKKIKRFFLLILTLVLIISGLSFYSAWRSCLLKTEDQMKRDAATISLLVNNSLESGLKILRLTEPRITGKLLHGKDAWKNPELSAVLSSCMEEFGLTSSNDQFGFLLDASGYLIARSGEDPHRKLDFSDRYFFTDLRDNPSKQFMVSSLRISEITGSPAFHIAIPLRNSQGSPNTLRGVLSLQIDAEKIDRELEKIVQNSGERIVMMMSNGMTIFQYPLLPLPLATDLLENSRVIQGPMASHVMQGGGAFLGSVGNIAARSHVITLPHDKFGLSTSVLIPRQSIATAFWSVNSHLLYLTVLTILLIGLFYIGLCMQARNLEKAIFDSKTDSNTGLWNRRHLEEELTRLLSQALRINSPLSVLFIDIDYFKSFNDTNGHDLGDKVLNAVAQCITKLAKRPLDCSCRWGGEEFVMVLPETSPEDAVKISNQLMAMVGRIEIGQLSKIPNHAITISVGIASTALFPDATPDELIVIADHAMLRAKEEGRNRVVLA
jgi:diguanylate cyclase (GGDEF)-like protein